MGVYRRLRVLPAMDRCILVGTAMLERIALHQARLRTPGLSLDGKGVALGAKGFVLFPSIDRLVAWLSIYTREHSLEDLMPSLAIGVVRSKLGTRELSVTFAAESSDRMDRVTDTVRLVGGFVFTGTSRHFVQYRDASAPFGYDAPNLLPTDAPVALYHTMFTQVYEVEKPVDLRALLLRLMPHVDPKTVFESGPRVIVAEQGLGPALIHYFVRSQVEGEVAIGEWPPLSAFDDAPVRRYIFRIPELPARMRTLMTTTPGLTTFVPTGPGAAVESGYRHPVSLRACPVFPPQGLVLLRGRGDEPWVLDRLPPMGDLRAFARVELRENDTFAKATGARLPDPVRVPLRIVPSMGALRNVTASFIEPAKLPLLRRLAYALSRQTITRTQIALTPHGAFLRSDAGIEAIPLGTFFVKLHPSLYIPAGYDVSPTVAPEVLYRALGVSASQVIFIDANTRALSVDESAFSPLEMALLEAPPWEPVVADAITRALEEKPIALKLEPLATFALSQVAPLETTSAENVGNEAVE